MSAMTTPSVVTRGDLALTAPEFYELLVVRPPKRVIGGVLVKF